MAQPRFTPYVLPNRQNRTLCEALKRPKEETFKPFRYFNLSSCKLMSFSGTYTAELAVTMMARAINLSDDTFNKILRKRADGNPYIATVVQVPPGFTEDGSDVHVLVVGLAMLFHLAKEIVPENKPYVWARIKAIGAQSNHIGLKNLTEQQVSYMIKENILSTAKTQLERGGFIRDILEDALTMPATGNDFKTALVKNISMVVRGYGMTATQNMAYFITVPTKALFLDIVLTEAESFKKKLDEFKTIHGTNWDLGRVLNLDGISGLDNSNFPHLYYCSISRAEGTRSGLGRYKRSNFPLQESEKILSDAANTTVQAESILTDALAARISAISGKDVKSLVGRRI